MTLYLIILVFVGLCNSFEITRDQLPLWLSEKQIDDFHKAYLNLDYNNDKFVSFHELKLGIVSNLDHSIFEADKNRRHKDASKDEYWKMEDTRNHFEEWFNYQPESFSCVPTMDPIDFVDCMVLAARYTDMALEDDSFVLFETALSMYLGHECSDISPKSGVFCHDLIENDIISACQDSTNFCQISCYQCEVESNIFGTNVRGSNDEWKANSVKKVYHESNLDKYKEILAPMHAQSKMKVEQTPSDVMRRLLEQETQETEETTEYLHGPQKKVFHNVGSLKSPNSDISPTDTSCSISKRELHANSDRFFFITDAHIEPWYDVSGSGRVSRFTDSVCTVDNMFECHDSSESELSGESVTCALNGESDPPVDMYTSALSAISHRYTRIENSVLFFVGDLQAHDFTDGVQSPLVQTMTSLQYHFIKATFTYFNTDQIFITPGNNDGVHNSLFVNLADDDVDFGVSQSWAKFLISSDIVNNDLNRKYTIDGTYIEDWSQTDVFKTLGYYVKQLPEHGSDLQDTYVIVLNTNLGSTNFIQNKVFKSDLDWIHKTLNGKAIILAHHPNVVSSMIKQSTLDAGFIIGIFSGHVHYFSETDENGFTILPALSQYSYVNAIASSDINKENGKLSIDESQLLVYNGVNGESANYACWNKMED